MPLIGFYLQPAVGGLDLGAAFWARFAAIANVVAIKVAPFNRYRTIDVVRGLVAAARRGADRALHRQRRPHRPRPGHAFRGDARRRRGDGALSRRPARPLVGLDPERGRLARALQGRGCAAEADGAVERELLALDSRVTDCNSAFFDVAHGFRGCIAGCHEVLRRQGLLEGIWCLDPDEGLSPGQREEIDRVCREHADLSDDAFVAAHLERWLG